MRLSQKVKVFSPPYRITVKKNGTNSGGFWEWQFKEVSNLKERGKNKEKTVTEKKEQLSRILEQSLKRQKKLSSGDVSFFSLKPMNGTNSPKCTIVQYKCGK